MWLSSYTEWDEQKMALGSFEDLRYLQIPLKINKYFKWIFNFIFSKLEDGVLTYVLADFSAPKLTFLKIGKTIEIK